METPRLKGTPFNMRKQLIEIVQDVARREVMPRYLKVAHSRKHDGSLFTEADLACQNALIVELTRLADYPVVGEEMPHQEQQTQWQAGDKGLWCIDPIDGTSNFVNGIPYFAVSVALMRQGRSVMGAIYDPVSDEMFSAEKHHGAWLNDERLPLASHARDLRHSLAGVDLKRIPASIAAQIALNPPYSSHRNFGASTLDWCYVAAGRLDLYLHGGQKLWDYAAGSLILEEAGGHYRSLENADFWADDPWQRSVIAALDPRLLSEWSDWITGISAA